MTQNSKEKSHLKFLTLGRGKKRKMKWIQCSFVISAFRNRVWSAPSRELLRNIIYSLKIYPCCSWEGFPSYDTKNISKSTVDEFNYLSALYITIHYPEVIKIKHLDAIVPVLQLVQQNVSNQCCLCLWSIINGNIIMSWTN